MLMVALVLAVIGLAALVAAVVTSNEIIAWVCIGASALGVVLLVVDAIRERQNRRAAYLGAAGTDAEMTEVIEAVDAEPESGAESGAESEPESGADSGIDSGVDAEIEAEIAEEEHPEEVVHDEPEYDTYSDDEPEYPQPAEESAVHSSDEDTSDEDGTDRPQ